MINLVHDTIDRDDIKALIAWLDQDPIPQLTKDQLTIELERKWAYTMGTEYSVFVNSGSSAILLVLAALRETGRLTNNRIVAPALSWITDVSSPLLLDFDVSLCDCNLEDLSCDLEHLERLFDTERPAVFLSVAPLGLVPDMDEILRLCNQYQVLLIEDICESMGSQYRERFLGGFGLASVFSTYYGHHLSTVEGGFINTNDQDLYHAMLMMRSHGWDRDLPPDRQQQLREAAAVDDFQSLYTFHLPGMNLRSTDIQAFLGIRAIDKLEQYRQLRRSNFHTYQRLIKNNILTLGERESDFVSNFAYPMVSPNRKRIVAALRAADIACRPLIAGNMARNPFWRRLNLPTDDLPNADLVHDLGFYVPNHQNLSYQDIQQVCDIINSNNE